MTKFCPKCNKEFHASVFIEHLKSHHSDETIMLCILQELMEINERGERGFND